MLEGSQTSFQIIRQLYWWSQICLQPVARGLTCCPLCYSAHLSPHIFNYLFTRTAAGAESRSSFILLFKLVLNSTLSCIKRSLKLSFVKLPHSSFLLSPSSTIPSSSSVSTSASSSLLLLLLLGRPFHLTPVPLWNPLPLFRILSLFPIIPEVIRCLCSQRECEKPTRSDGIGRDSVCIRISINFLLTKIVLK